MSKTPGSVFFQCEKYEKHSVVRLAVRPPAECIVHRRLKLDRDAGWCQDAC